MRLFTVRHLCSYSLCCSLLDCALRGLVEWLFKRRCIVSSSASFEFFGKIEMAAEQFEQSELFIFYFYLNMINGGGDRR
jgi:hypothetical protein